MSFRDRIPGLLLAIAGVVLWTLPTIAVGAEPARTPAGVYVHVDIESALKQGKVDKASETQRRAYLKSEVTKLLASPAISGIAVGEHWNTIEPTAPAAGDKSGQCANCDWGYLDDVFAAATALPGKTVQLIITPGFDTPQWLKAKLKPCDGLFDKSKVDPDCGSVKFVDFPEQDHGDPDASGNYVLPLPWNDAYQSAWWTFLAALNQHFKGQSRLVAVAIAGPVAGSDEIILPATANGLDTSKGEFSKTAVGGIAADDAWSALIANYDKGTGVAKYAADSDQIFIDAWKTAIDKYASIFSGLTIFIGPDAGGDLPTFGQTKATPHGDDAALYAVDCGAASAALALSCEAKTEIIAYFTAATGPDQKATQVGGLKAASAADPGDIGVAGVKLLTAPYANLWTKPQAIAGAEFDHAVSNPADGMGCPSKKGDCTLSPEKAAANVLQVFFHNTTADQSSDKGAGNLNQTMNYLDVPLEDVEYLEKQGCAAPSGQTPLLQQIAEANYELLVMAGEKPVAVNVCAPAKPPIKPPAPIQKQ